MSKRAADEVVYQRPVKRFASPQFLKESQRFNNATYPQTRGSGKGFSTRAILIIDSITSKPEFGADNKLIKGDFYLVDPVSKGTINLPKEEKDFRFEPSDDGTSVMAFCKVKKNVPLKNPGAAKKNQKYDKEMVLDNNGGNLVVTTRLMPNVAYSFSASDNRKVVPFSLNEPFMAEVVISLSATKQKKKKNEEKESDKTVPQDTSNIPATESGQLRPVSREEQKDGGDKQKDGGEKQTSQYDNEEVVYTNFRLDNIKMINGGGYSDLPDKTADFYCNMERAIIACHQNRFLFEPEAIEEISAAKGHLFLRLSGNQIEPPQKKGDSKYLVYPGQFVHRFYPAEEPRVPENDKEKDPVFAIDLETRIVIPNKNQESKRQYIKQLIKFKFETLPWTQKAPMMNLGIDTSDKDILGTFFKSVIYFDCLAEVAPSLVYRQDSENDEEGETRFSTVYSVTPHKFLLKEKSVEPFSFDLSKETFVDIFTHDNATPLFAPAVDNPLFNNSTNANEKFLREKIMDSVTSTNNIMCLNSFKGAFLPAAVQALAKSTDDLRFFVTFPPWLVTRAIQKAIEDGKGNFTYNNDESPIDNVLRALGMDEEYAAIVDKEAKRLEGAPASVSIETGKGKKNAGSKGGKAGQQTIAVTKEESPYVDFFDSLLKKLKKFHEEHDKIKPKLLIWVALSAVDDDSHTMAATSYISEGNVEPICLENDVHDPADDYVALDEEPANGGKEAPNTEQQNKLVEGPKPDQPPPPADNGKTGDSEEQEQNDGDSDDDDDGDNDDDDDKDDDKDKD